ncbi:MAG: hypothetical protein AAGA09_04535 [Pseudomonadota bacterium]
MKGNSVSVRASARFGSAARFVSGVFCLAFLAAGCAAIPVSNHVSSSHQKEVHQSRDALVAAARAVKQTPWPKPAKTSIASRIMGAGGGERLSHADAVSSYVEGILTSPGGGRFAVVRRDANLNLAAADVLASVADQALGATRLSSSDVAIVEGAIQALRENRKMVVSAARLLQKEGDMVDADELAMLRTNYQNKIRDLGRTADAIADEVARDRTETYAEPGQGAAKRFF